MVRGTVAALPLRDASMDLATSFDVLYCLDDRTEMAAVREMWRVLAPGGLALVNVAALDLLHGSHSALTMEVRRYTPTRLTALLSGAGFTVSRVTFTNMATFPLTLAVRLRDRWSGRAAEASDADLQVPPAPVNALLSMAVGLDGALLRVMNLPIGSSLMCLARKNETGSALGRSSTFRLP
jgi:SAM-dependent methyltransferase